MQQDFLSIKSPVQGPACICVHACVHAHVCTWREGGGGVKRVQTTILQQQTIQKGVALHSFLVRGSAVFVHQVRDIYILSQVAA